MAVLAALTTLEVSTAPLGTSTGGLTWQFDPLLRTEVRSSMSYGPAFAQRSLTTGKGKISIGLNWLKASYASFNDQDLDNGEFRPATNVTGLGLSYSSLNLHLSSSTVVAFGHLGVTDSLDLGLAIPWIHITMSADGGLFTTTGIKVATSRIPGWRAYGVGDVAVLMKYRLIKQEGGGLSTAVEVRLPTGEKESFRGLGVGRTLVSGIWSRGGRLSPHGEVGYEFWTGRVPISQSGDVFAKDQAKFAVGVEIEAHPTATVLVDVLGRRLRHGGSVGYQTFAAVDSSNSTADVLVGLPEGIGQTAIAFGVKWNAWRDILITTNLLKPISNRGMRARLVSVVGLDWTF